MSTETVAPKTSALCQPKDIFLDFGLAAIQMENKEMAKEAMSVRRCAASVAMAKELLSTPPTTSAVMKKVQRQIALSSLKTALNQKDDVSSEKEFHIKQCTYFLSIESCSEVSWHSDTWVLLLCTIVPFW